jgi:hypothetical protein
MAKQPTGPGFIIGADEGGADGGLKATLANFDIDGDELKPGHAAFLDARVVPLLRASNDKGLSATGSASDSPPEARNPGLAERRAQAVLGYVIGKGISEIRMWLGESAKASGQDAGVRSVSVQLTSTYDPTLDAEFQRLNGLSMTPEVPDLLTELTKMSHARLTSLRAHVAQAKGINVGRMIVALDAVMQRGSHVSEWRSLITAEAIELLPLESDQQRALEEYMNAKPGSAPPPAFKRPRTPLPRVKSSKITIAGQPFRDWFNGVFFSAQQPAEKLRPIFDRRWMALIGSGFQPVFDKLPVLTGRPDVSFNAFVGYFLIAYNETGGTFVPRTEVPQVPKDKLGTFYEDKYFFEPKEHPKKVTYNRPHPAGDFLRTKKVISLPEDVAVWNSATTYPMDQPDSMKMAARDAEFYKFRGRGIIQHTFRSGYLPLAGVLMEKSGKTLDELTNDELDELMKDPDVFLRGAQLYMRGAGFGVGGAADLLNAFDQDPPDFVPIAKAVAGKTATDYHRKVVARAAELLNAIIDAGPVTAE